MSKNPELLDTRTKFGYWYLGNVFATTDLRGGSNGNKPSQWATDGRLMVKLSAVKTKSARESVTKRKIQLQNIADGDEKVAKAIAQSEPQTHSATILGEYEFPSVEHENGKRALAIVEADGKPYAFAPAVVEWMLKNVKHTSTWADRRGNLWLCNDGEPVALLMQVSFDEGTPLGAAVCTYFKLKRQSIERKKATVRSI